MEMSSSDKVPKLTSILSGSFDADDDTSFFDLEFSSKTKLDTTTDACSQSSVDDDALDPTSVAVLSPSDELFLNTSSIVITTSDPESKSVHFPVKFKFHVLNKFFVKFKIEEVPVISLFNSRKSSNPKDANGAKEEEEKVVFSKVGFQKYVRKIKPLYVKVSKKYGDDVAKEAVRVVRKRLGKSKSAVVASVTSPAAEMVGRRRDDSLVEKEDGIQSAIAHCKESFHNASVKGAKAPLFRSLSDPTDDRS